MNKKIKSLKRGLLIFMAGTLTVNLAAMLLHSDHEDRIKKLEEEANKTDISEDEGEE